MFSVRFNEVMREANEPAEEEVSAEEIKERMIRKSLELTGGID